jgi:hypothetical protein
LRIQQPTLDAARLCWLLHLGEPRLDFANRALPARLNHNLHLHQASQAKDNPCAYTKLATSQTRATANADRRFAKTPSQTIDSITREKRQIGGFFANLRSHPRQAAICGKTTTN